MRATTAGAGTQVFDRLRWLFVLGLFALAMAAVAEPVRLAPDFVPVPKGEKLFVVPADVQLYSISAGGVTEPRADWSTAARAHLRKAFEQKLRDAGYGLVTLSEAAIDDFGEQLGLQSATARAILVHHFGSDRLALPSKQGRLDWSLGDSMRPLAAAAGARYAFFVNVRDTYASGERKAAAVGMALLGALTGVVVVPSMGWQSAQAMLIDLETGRVLWFNSVSRGSGDLRDEASGLESVNALMTGFPATR